MEAINPELHVPNEHPAFFKVYVPEICSKALRIPHLFIENFGGWIPRAVSLTDSTGRIWPAKVAFRSQEVHITEGWQQCTSDLKLKRGDFFVVRYVQNSTFLVTAYGIDGCQKKASGGRILKNRGDRFAGARGGHPTDLLTPDLKFRFQRVFRSNFKNFVTIPNKVLMKCIFTLDQRITVMSNDGHWVTSQLRITCDRFILGYTGLKNLWRMMGVQKGDKLEFEVICENGNKIKEIVVHNRSKLNRAY